MVALSPEPTVTLEDLPGIVSVDDHIVEPPRLWQDRLPAKFLERGPRVVREYIGLGGVALEPGDPDGRWSDVWYYEDARVPTLRIYASVGLQEAFNDGSPDLMLSEAIGMTYDEMRPSCYEPAALLRDMDMNGVDASLGFPNLILRFCGQLFLDGAAKDPELALLGVRAYNDWLREEWERVGDGRLIGTTIMPLWDPQLCADEVRRNAEKGSKAICFSEIPARLGLPSLHGGEWDPFFRAVEETDQVIAIHIGSSSSQQATSMDAPPALGVTNLYTNSSVSLSDFLLSNVFSKFPGLRVAYAEAQAGWIPYIVDRLDNMYSQNHKFMRMNNPEPPSYYYRRHIYSCIFDDRVAIESLLDRIGVEHLCWETDYPHADSTWPQSREVALKNLAGLDADTMTMILRDNAIEMLRLDESKLVHGS